MSAPNGNGKLGLISAIVTIGVTVAGSFWLLSNHIDNKISSAKEIEDMRDAERQKDIDELREKILRLEVSRCK